MATYLPSSPNSLLRWSGRTLLIRDDRLGFFVHALECSYLLGQLPKLHTARIGRTVFVKSLKSRRSNRVCGSIQTRRRDGPGCTFR
jgi:hypothetical protein